MRDFHSGSGIDLLLLAAEWGNLEKIKDFEAQGIQLRAYNDQALRTAAYYGHLDIVKYLVSKGARIVPPDRIWVLSTVAENGHLDVVKYFFAQGFFTKKITENALRRAKLNGKEKVAHFLQLCLNTDKLSKMLVEGILKSEANYEN